jgi:hypothetical protein
MNKHDNAYQMQGFVPTANSETLILLKYFLSVSKNALETEIRREILFGKEFNIYFNEK